MKRIFIVAGDPSGDLIASRLIESMKKMEPELYVVGIGGNHLKKVSDRFLGNIVQQHALGFAISLKKILYFKHVLHDIILPELIQNPPDAVIPVDFYGFNGRVAQAAKKIGLKVFYYVSPQFWASRPWRAENLRKSVDLFLCLFPFEMTFYQKRKLPAQFVGHPILDSLPYVTTNERHRQHVEPHVGLLPGSRPEELKRHIPVMMETCAIIAAANPGTRFLLFTVPHVHRDLYLKLISKGKNKNLLIELIQDENFVWRSQLDMAITASGMETLENTLLGIPMVIMYKTNWITYWIARSLIQIPFVGMPNLLAGKGIIPEFIQWKATAENISKPILNWMKNPTEQLLIREELLKLRLQFGEVGASERAARAILGKVA